jgi:hypothetical protein
MTLCAQTLKMRCAHKPVPGCGQYLYVRWSGRSHITALMMGTEMIPETLAIFSQLTRLIAREDFINVCRRESFRSYLSATFEPIIN